MIIPRGFLWQIPKQKILHGDRAEGRALSAEQMSWNTRVCLNSQTAFLYTRENIWFRHAIRISNDSTVQN